MDCWEGKELEDGAGPHSRTEAEMLAKWVWSCCFSFSAVRTSAAIQGREDQSSPGPLWCRTSREVMGMLLCRKEGCCSETLRWRAFRNLLTSSRQDGGGRPRSHLWSWQMAEGEAGCVAVTNTQRIRFVSQPPRLESILLQRTADTMVWRRLNRTCLVSRLLSSSSAPGGQLTSVAVLPTFPS